MTCLDERTLGRWPAHGAGAALCGTAGVYTTFEVEMVTCEQCLVLLDAAVEDGRAFVDTLATPFGSHEVLAAPDSPRSWTLPPSLAAALLALRARRDSGELSALDYRAHVLAALQRAAPR